MPALIGPVVGPPVGGFIVTYASWRWIFYINVPIGVLGIVLVSLFVEDVREPPRGGFDAFGLLLSGVALSGLMFGLETAGRGVVSALATETMITVGVACALGYWLHARRHPAPLLDLSLLRLPCFRVAISAMILFRAGIGAIPFLLPLMLQVGFGRTAAQSGLITFASSAGALVMKPATQFMLRRLGFRDTLVWNGVLSACLLAACGFFRPTWPAAAIYAVLLVGGFFRSLQFTAFNALAYADIPRSRMSGATSLYSCIQQLSMTLGISCGAAALEISMALNHRAIPAIPDFTAAFLAVASVCVLAAPASLAMPRDAGAELAGRPVGSRAAPR
jgi:MFS family permease